MFTYIEKLYPFSFCTVYITDINSSIQLKSFSTKGAFIHNKGNKDNSGEKNGGLKITGIK